MAAARFVVSGRVQGVGFRYFTLREARALGLSGFVRNQPDGTVEVVAEGAAELLATLADRLRDGPAFAEVVAVERSEVAATQRGDFCIR
jgi:acylphosphatase